MNSFVYNNKLKTFDTFKELYCFCNVNYVIYVEVIVLNNAGRNRYVNFFDLEQINICF